MATKWALDRESHELRFTFSVDGWHVATFADKSVEHIETVAGGGLALRGFRGLATLHSLELHESS
jgi:hypothetical protein